MATDKQIADVESLLVRMQRNLDQEWKQMEAAQEHYGILLSPNVPIRIIRACVALVATQCSFNETKRILEDMK